VNTSDAGLRYTLSKEGLVNHLYNDNWRPTGGNCTIGVGHLVHLGPCTYADSSEFPYFNGLTDEEALVLLRQDIPRYEAVVDSHAMIPLNQNQYDALVDFCFNTGGGYSAVWNAVNNGSDVAAVLLVTAVTPEQFRPQLTQRRREEGERYNTPVEDRLYTDQQIDDKVGAVLGQCIALGQKLDTLNDNIEAQRHELLVLGHLIATGRTTEADVRIKYEATAAGITLP